MDFPVNGLDISNFVINPELPEEYFTEKMVAEEKNPVFYDLVGITNHFGGTGGGHYTAYAK